VSSFILICRGEICPPGVVIGFVCELIPNPLLVGILAPGWKGLNPSNSCEGLLLLLFLLSSLLSSGENRGEFESDVVIVVVDDLVVVVVVVVVVVGGNFAKFCGDGGMNELTVVKEWWNIQYGAMHPMSIRMELLTVVFILEVFCGA